MPFLLSFAKSWCRCTGWKFRAVVQCRTEDLHATKNGHDILVCFLLFVTVFKHSLWSDQQGIQCNLSHLQLPFPLHGRHWCKFAIIIGRRWRARRISWIAILILGFAGVRWCSRTDAAWGSLVGIHWRSLLRVHWCSHAKEKMGDTTSRSILLEKNGICGKAWKVTSWPLSIIILAICQYSATSKRGTVLSIRKSQLIS